MSHSKRISWPILTLVLTLVSAVPSLAQPRGRGGDALLRDATFYSLDFDVDVEEAVRRFHLQDLAGQLGARLALDEWATFAGLSVEHTPEFRVVVRFTQSGKATLHPYLAQSPLARFVEIRPAVATLAQLETAQELAVRAARRLGIAFDAGISLAANRAELYVLDREAFADALAAAGIRLPPHVEVIEVEHLSQDEAEIYAGLSLSTCTAGWSVRHPNGTLGIVTAGHCGANQSYLGVALPFMAEVFFGSCDVQWHRDANHTAVPKFLATQPCCPRAITATRPRGNQAVGNFVCKWGKGSGFTCGNISDVSFAPGYVPNVAPVYIRVRSNGGALSAAGDSGGPWYNGNTGYGVHNCGIGNDACYMAINLIPACLGVNVVLAP